MKVLVTVEATFEVDVETHDPARAHRAIEAKWESVYRFQARWAHGTAPQHQHGRIVTIHVEGE